MIAGRDHGFGDDGTFAQEVRADPPPGALRWIQPPSATARHTLEDTLNQAVSLLDPKQPHERRETSNAQSSASGA